MNGQQDSFKPLSFEGWFECGGIELSEGKLAALVAVIQPEGIGLGLAIANDPGYYPIPRYWCRGNDWSQMKEHADNMNLTLLKLDAEQACKIVASTMRGKVPRRAA